MPGFFVDGVKTPSPRRPGSRHDAVVVPTPDPKVRGVSQEGVAGVTFREFVVQHGLAYAFLRDETPRPFGPASRDPG